MRLTHRPTGTVVTATERRSQHANREAAYVRMAERLEEMQREVKPRAPSRLNRTDHERRLAEKRRASAIKRLRGTPASEE